MPELYEMAQIVFAVPPTQVSVERVFSALNHIFGSDRNRINPDMLADQLLVALNK